MPNTDLYWDIDGVSLHEHAWSISTMSGRVRTPAHRGENQKVPYRPGAIWVPKGIEENQISLAMWVIGTNADGVVVESQRDLFDRNWRTLAQLLWTENDLHTVTKRWKDPASGLVKSASALCEVVDAIDVQIEGKDRGVFTVDLVLPDVWFFGVEQESIIPLNTPTVVANVGDSTLRWMEIVLEGGLVNPELRNSSTDPDVWVAYGGTIADDAQVDLATKRFTARGYVTLAGPDTGANVIGAVSRSGSRYWMALPPGPSTLILTATSGDGRAIVRHQAPYF